MHVDVTAAARRRAERDKAAQEAADTLAEIEAIGVQVQDLEEGLLDFPCMMDGKTVMLCWKLGEDAITHWHGPEAARCWVRKAGAGTAELNSGDAGRPMMCRHFKKRSKVQDSRCG